MGGWFCQLLFANFAVLFCRENKNRPAEQKPGGERKKNAR